MVIREEERLELEITKLKQDLGMAGRLRAMLPFVTVLVAVGGLWLTAAQFTLESRLNRVLRWEGEVSAYVQELLTFPADDDFTLARASFVVRELGRLHTHLGDTENVTLTLIEMMEHDCNFDNRRHVGFDIALLIYWPDYAETLAASPERQDFIVYKYFQAFRRLYGQDPEYFGTLSFDSASGYVVGDGGYIEDEEAFRRFETLVRGFRQHLAEMEDELSRRVTAIALFHEAIPNSELGEALFGLSAADVGVQAAALSPR